MHLQVTLSVRHDTKVVHAGTTRGLAARAKEEELQARSELKEWFAVIAIVYGIFLSVDLYLLSWYGILVFAVCITCGEFFMSYVFKTKGPLMAAWYEYQWQKKWRLEYYRLNAPDSHHL